MMPEAAPLLEQENARLRTLLERQGLQVDALWPPSPGTPDARVENARLHDLHNWVRAYRACPDRRALEQQGFLYPPVEPDCDPDSDWLLFTRWMAGQPVRWTFAAEFGALPDPEGLSEAEAQAQFDRIVALLEPRGVAVELQDAVPATVAYRCLKASLESQPFEYMAPGTVCHLTGCDGYCPGCLQRPWCELGREEAWPEDEEAGHLVCPDAVLPAMQRAVPSLPQPH